MNANQRIQWFHQKVCEGCYPNAAHLSERFQISHRQAQRDVEFLRTHLNAPLKYSLSHKGYYYGQEFSIPVMMMEENDSDYQHVLNSLRDFSGRNAERSVIQMQLPYTALLEITDRITVMNLRSIIVGEEPHHRYRCEFPSVELFLGIIMSAGADIRIIEPEWLRLRLVEFATRVLSLNAQPPEAENSRKNKKNP